MRNAVLLLVTIIALFLLSSLALEVIYGPSYGFLQGEDCWVPDGNGGWLKHGHPDGPPPSRPSVDVPVGVRYIPIFLPALVLILFVFTPLRKHVDWSPAEDERPLEDRNETDNSTSPSGLQ